MVIASSIHVAQLRADKLTAVSVDCVGSNVTITILDDNSETGFLTEADRVYHFYDYSTKKPYTIVSDDKGYEWFAYIEGTKIWFLKTVYDVFNYINDNVTELNNKINSLETRLAKLETK